mmetsp:Transcript_28458/g.47302  ORF Transcript_28458/g.47302 Transcript_28458/m.47302 type:complete len:537 (-) Transcript_28458:1446-3056(-)
MPPSDMSSAASSRGSRSSSWKRPHRKRKQRWGPRHEESRPGAFSRSASLPLRSTSMRKYRTIPSSEHQYEDDLSYKRYSVFRRGRSTSSCRFNESTFEQKHNSEWRCLVCYLWNNRDKGNCERCSSKRGLDSKGDTVRTAAASSTKPSARWPPVFETNGSDYVFDSRSGMFYEPLSEFFYDPKTKLYYGNTLKTYFKYDPRGYPPFSPVQDGGGAAQEDSLQPEPVCAAPTRKGSPQTITESSSDEDRQQQVLPHPTASRKRSRSASRSASRSISIKIKSSSECGHSKDTSEIEERIPLDRKRKEHLDHIAKWQAQQVQAKMSNTAVGSHPSKIADGTVGSSSGASCKDEAPVLPPVRLGDKVICTLCRRQFPDTYTLTRHEQLSKLHKDNLAKQASQMSKSQGDIDQPSAALGTDSTKNQNQAQYIDRAAKRRRLHGVTPETATIKSILPLSAGETGFQVSEHVSACSLVGEKNIGNQMFQKMAAKSSAKPTRDPTLAHDSLEREWFRIETISSGNDPTRRMALQQSEKWGLGSL